MPGFAFFQTGLLATEAKTTFVPQSSDFESHGEANGTGQQTMEKGDWLND